MTFTATVEGYGGKRLYNTPDEFLATLTTFIEDAEEDDKIRFTLSNFSKPKKEIVLDDSYVSVLNSFVPEKWMTASEIYKKCKKYMALRTLYNKLKILVEAQKIIKIDEKPIKFKLVGGI